MIQIKEMYNSNHLIKKSYSSAWANSLCVCSRQWKADYMYCEWCGGFLFVYIYVLYLRVGTDGSGHCVTHKVYRMHQIKGSTSSRPRRRVSLPLRHITHNNQQDRACLSWTIEVTGCNVQIYREWAKWDSESLVDDGWYEVAYLTQLNDRFPE